MKTHFNNYGLDLHNLGYDVVPIVAGSKACKVPGWTTIKSTPELIREWQNRHTGCGIRGPFTVGVDIDAYDADLVQHMLDFTYNQLGVVPYRIGMKPKALLAYRCERPFKKLQSNTFQSPDEKSHKLEILAEGQQFVAAHIHPETKEPYLWHYPDGEIRETLTIEHAALPVITEEVAHRILNEFNEQSAARGWISRLVVTHSSTPADELFLPELCPENERVIVRDALLSMPSDDRNLWQRMGHALKVEGETGWGYDLWIEWSIRSPKFNEDQDIKTWLSFKPTRTCYRSILAEAQRQGWQNPNNREVQEIKAVIDSLAKLDLIEYELKREQAAEKYNLRVSALDKAVEALRERAHQEQKSQHLPAVIVWPDPVAGDELLDDIVTAIQSHIACDYGTAAAAALWVSFTWFIDQVNVAPLAVITAPEKRCGKSQLLTVLGRLSRNPMITSNISSAALFRLIEAESPTLLIDEADSSFMDNPQSDLRNILNSGHTRDLAYVIRAVGDDHVPTRFSTWGAKAIAGIGERADTIMDRAIVLALRRKLPTENISRLRYCTGEPFNTLVQKLARFAQDNAEAVALARPSLPDQLHDRAQDNWEPLLAIADIAGGHWPQTARNTAISLSESPHTTNSRASELLADIRDAFEKNGKQRLPSSDLIQWLRSDEEKPWGTYNRGQAITTRQLSKLLRGFDIRSKDIKIDGVVKKGYERKSFEDAFTRYLQPSQDEVSATEQLRSKNSQLLVADAYDGSATSTNEATLSHLKNKESCSFEDLV